MAYAQVQMFMKKLTQLMYSNDNSVINNPSILCERPQFRLLYEELGSVIQTLFNHEDQDPHNFEKIIKLKERFKAAAEEAEDIVDIFLSTVHCRNNGFFPRSDVFHPSLHLEVVMRSIQSIKMEFMTMRIDSMKMDSSQRTGRLQIQSAAAAAGTSRIRSSLGSKKVSQEMVVGLDHDVEIIRNKLVEDGKHRDVVSVVGMGGIGKTTLANKVFTDPFVVYHFYVRAWVTVSQTYEKRDLLSQILSSIDDELQLDEATDSQLREMLHKRLNRKRYLIVIDDIWSKEAWDKLKLFFPDHNNGSRILVTSRLTEVALHATSYGFVHHLQHLTEEESWELLCKEVFQGDECPECLTKPGMQIAKNCHGLPLSVVVMAGVLAKEPRSKDLWLKISCSVSSYIASDERGCLETIALSYHHLPLHLRACSLYLGQFSEGSRIYTTWLIWQWMAEGFIQEDGSRSLEEIAEGYLVDLLDRNLIIGEKWFAGGKVGVCKLHDLVRQLCMEKGKEERFFLKIDTPPSEHLCEVITTHKQRRVVSNQEIDIISLSRTPTPSIRSLVCHHEYSIFLYNMSKFFGSFALLRVLRLEKCKLIDFPPSLALLVHLRFLTIWLSSFPPSICNLWNLETLIVRTSSSSMILPNNISNLVNLRHLGCNVVLYLPSVRKPMMLEFISNVVLGDGIDNFQKCFPIVRKLACTFYSYEENDFEILGYLEILILTGSAFRRRELTKPDFLRGEPNLSLKHMIRFPATLKELVFVRCRLPWTEMSIIQLLPNLESLTIVSNGFEGTLWETGEEQFQKLKLLRLHDLNIKQWEASSISFPCLQVLQVVNCVDLQEIPLELGDISTLKHLLVKNCGASLRESLQNIRREQDNVGNTELHIKVDGREMPSCVPEHDN